MDVEKALRELYAERERISKVIAGLEANSRPSMRLRRPMMTAEARMKVSERMQKYWANRRGSQPSPLGEPTS